MKGIFYWLGMNLPRGPGSDTADGQHGSADDDGPNDPSNIGEFQDNIDGLMPDIYGEQTDDDTVPHLRIIKNRPKETDESTGFDPYDTAKFHKG